jgi:molecular chaperone DnaK (HSP70)
MGSSLRLALDFGTTNSVVAVTEEGSVRVVSLPGLACPPPPTRITGLTGGNRGKRDGGDFPAEPVLVPTAIFVTGQRQRSFLPLLPPLPRSPFGRRPRLDALVGQPACERDYDGQSPAFARSFKSALSDQPHRPVARTAEGTITVSSREAAYLFLRGTLAAAARAVGERRITDLTIPAPVAYYETYRAELTALARRLGIARLRTLDEPVAAALGYGINVGRNSTLLVVDFGGGTLNLAVVRLGPEAGESGAAPVLAKHMVALGGDDVDRWLLAHLLGSDFGDLPEWQHDALAEARRLKEAGGGEFRWRGVCRPLSPDALVGVLTDNGLYERLRVALGEIKRQLAEAATTEVTGGGSTTLDTVDMVRTVDEVLMVGGSTLLPGVAAVVDEALPGAVVRHDPAWVFTVVALGAARFAGGVAVEDHIYHDYALAVQNPETHAVEFELLVPRRTRYPTTADFVTRYYADYAGMNEVRFQVCEVGRLGQAPVAWQLRSNGGRYWSPSSAAGANGVAERALPVELNPGDAPLALQPPGQGTSPRLRVTYSINADRWLCTSVEDLVSKRILRDGEPVVRLR